MVFVPLVDYLLLGFVEIEKIVALLAAFKRNLVHCGRIFRIKFPYETLTFWFLRWCIGVSVRLNTNCWPAILLCRIEEGLFFYVQILVGIDNKRILFRHVMPFEVLILNFIQLMTYWIVVGIVSVVDNSLRMLLLFKGIWNAQCISVVCLAWDVIFSVGKGVGFEESDAILQRSSLNFMRNHGVILTHLEFCHVILYFSLE